MNKFQTWTNGCVFIMQEPHASKIVILTSVTQDFSRCDINTSLKLLSHVFPVILTWICIIITVSDYCHKFKVCDFPEFRMT